MALFKLLIPLFTIGILAAIKDVGHMEILRSWSAIA